MEDNGKTVAILSYCTFIGFIIALVLHFQNDKNNRSSLGIFHIRQVMGIIFTSIALGISTVIFTFIPILGWIIAICIYLSYFALFVFFIIGLVNAINGEEKPLPLVGEFYQKIFASVQ